MHINDEFPFGTDVEQWRHQLCSGRALPFSISRGVARSKNVEWTTGRASKGGQTSNLTDPLPQKENSSDLHQSQVHPLAEWGGHVHPSPPSGDASVCNVIMRPSSLGGGRILRRTLSVCLSVRLSVCPSVRPSRACLH